MNWFSRYLALGLVLAFAAACSDQGPTPTVITPRVADGVITCQATVATRVVTCDSQLQTSSGMALDVTPLGGANGGAGAYVKLTSSSTAYATGTFTSSVTLQNLTAQPMGTADGTAADANGVRVFFASGPTVTGGTGAVTVTGDGTATFTAPGQAYYQYAGPLASGATSTGKTWTFVVPATVTTFSFGVLVTAKLPDDNGVLHWTPVTVAAAGSTDFDEIAQANGELWAVGAAGKILHYTDAGGWVAQTSGVTQTLHSVEMHGSSSITGVAVGAAGTFLYYNGTSWVDHSTGSAELLSVSRVGGDVSPLWVACGLGGVIFTSADGQTWSQATSNTLLDLNVCGGPSATDIYAAGGTLVTPAFITHSSNGSTWSSTGYTSTGTNIFRTAVGCGASGLSDLYLAGDGGSIQHAVSPFTTFTAQTSGTSENIYGMTNPSNSCADLYVVGSNALIMHFNGTSWSAQNSGLTVTIFNDIEVRLKNDGSFLDAWVIGNTGTILHGTR